MIPGLILALVLGSIAVFAAPFAPILGAPVLAIVFGVTLRAIIPLPPTLRPGLAYAGKHVLQAAIVVSGFGVSLSAIAHTGIATLPVMLATIVFALAAAPVLARVCGVGGAIAPLIAIGTSICGASAIAAASSVIEPDEHESSLAIATIFFYNVVGVLVFPFAGHALGFSQRQFGVWAGTAINDTSSVVAAAFAYGHAAGIEGTIVKLTRAMLILPLVGALALVRARRDRNTRRAVPWARVVPWFVFWFVAAAAVNTAGLIYAKWHDAIAWIATFAISVALAAIGLQTSLRELANTGTRPLLYGAGLWLLVAFSSLGIVRFVEH